MRACRKSERAETGRDTGQLTFVGFTVTTARLSITYECSADRSIVMQSTHSGEVKKRASILMENCEPAKAARGRIEGVVLAAYLWESETKGRRPSREMVESA